MGSARSSDDCTGAAKGIFLTARFACGMQGQATTLSQSRHKAFSYRYAGALSSSHVPHRIDSYPHTNRADGRKTHARTVCSRSGYFAPGLCKLCQPHGFAMRLGASAGGSNCKKCNSYHSFRVCGISLSKAYGAGLSGILSQTSTGWPSGRPFLFARRIAAASARLWHARRNCPSEAPWPAPRESTQPPWS